MVDFVDKSIAVTKMIVIMQHAAGTAMVNKGKRIVAVGMALVAFGAGTGVEFN